MTYQSCSLGCHLSAPSSTLLHCVNGIIPIPGGSSGSSGAGGGSSGQGTPSLAAPSPTNYYSSDCMGSAGAAGGGAGFLLPPLGLRNNLPLGFHPGE